MTVEDAEVLKAMPDEFTVYRACDPHYNLYEGDNLVETFGISEEKINCDNIEDTGISWTLDLDWCMGYAQHRGRIIKSKVVRKPEVFAYVSRQGKEEIILL